LSATTKDFDDPDKNKNNSEIDTSTGANKKPSWMTDFSDKSDIKDSDVFLNDTQTSDPEKNGLSPKIPIGHLRLHRKTSTSSRNIANREKRKTVVLTEPIILAHQDADQTNDSRYANHALIRQYSGLNSTLSNASPNPISTVVSLNNDKQTSIADILQLLVSQILHLKSDLDKLKLELTSKPTADDNEHPNSELNLQNVIERIDNVYDDMDENFEDMFESIKSLGDNQRIILNAMANMNQNVMKNMKAIQRLSTSFKLNEECFEVVELMKKNNAPSRPEKFIRLNDM
jgi:hypothetical protein